MASGSFEFDVSGYLQGKIDWWSSSNGASANSSSVTAVLYARRTNGYTTRGQSWSGYVDIAGTRADISFDSSVSVSSDWVEMARVNTTVGHNNAGNGSAYISGSVTGPSGTAAADWTTSGGQTVTLDTILRYAYYSVQPRLSNRTETTLDVYYKPDRTLTSAQYRIHNGSSWGAWTNLSIISGTWNSTSGATFRISGLTNNKTYKVQMRISAYSNGLWNNSNEVSMTTYDYPYCSESPNFTIGNALTLKFYNPLSRSITVTMIGADGTTKGESVITGTTLTGFNNEEWQEWLYSTIPNNNSGAYKVKVVYGSISTRTRNTGNTYNIDTSQALPTYEDFTYRDSNTDVTDITGNNQVLIKGKSILEITIPSASKMIAQKSATPKNYIINCDDLNASAEYSEQDIVTELGVISSSGTKRAQVTAYDSRNNSKSAYKDITVLDYTTPVVNNEISRLNKFEKTTTIKVSGTFTPITIDNDNKNTITAVQYRYREIGEEQWSTWVSFNVTIVNNEFTCSDVVLNLDNTKEFEFEFRATDRFDYGTGYGTVDIGIPIFFISSNNEACYINGQEIIMYDVVDEWND